MNWQSMLNKVGEGMLLTLGFLIMTNLPKLLTMASAALPRG